MTEADRVECTDPHEMPEALRGKAGERKLRLFAGACCRCGRAAADSPSHCLAGRPPPGILRFGAVVESSPGR